MPLRVMAMSESIADTVRETMRSPFASHPAHLETIPLPGPVFIHAESCERRREDDSIPPGLRGRPLLLSAYARGRRLVAEEVSEPGRHEESIERLLGLTDVASIYVRDLSAGCYDFRAEPILDPPSSAT